MWRDAKSEPARRDSRRWLRVGGIRSAVASNRHPPPGSTATRSRRSRAAAAGGARGTARGPRTPGTTTTRRIGTCGRKTRRPRSGTGEQFRIAHPSIVSPPLSASIVSVVVAVWRRRRCHRQRRGAGGASEIRAMLGNVSRQRASVIANQRNFPEPIAVLAMGKVWRKSDVEKWTQGTPPRRWRRSDADRRFLLTKGLSRPCSRLRIGSTMLTIGNHPPHGSGTT